MNLKPKIIPALLLILAIGLLVMVLSSCSVYYGIQQFDPYRKPPGAFERWYMKKHYHQNSQP